MIVGVMEVTFWIPEAQSLKDKRSITQSVIRRARNQANAAVAEVDGQDLWQRCTVAAAVIGTNEGHAKHQLHVVLKIIEREPRLEVTDVDYSYC